MAGPNIKLDLGQSVRDVQGFSDSISLLGRTVQQTFSQIIQNIQQFNNTISSAVGGPTGEVFSPSADTAQKDLIQAKMRRSAVESGIASGEYRTDPSTGNVIAFSTSGTRIVETAQRRNAREAFIRETERSMEQAKAQATQAATGATPTSGAAPGGLPGQEAARAASTVPQLSLYGAGRSLADMPKLLRQSEAFSASQQDSAKMVQALRSQNTLESSAVAKAIEDSNKTTAELAKAFREAVAVFNTTKTGSKEYEKAMVDMKNTMGALDQSIRERNELEKEGRRMGGGGGGGPGQGGIDPTKFIRGLQTAQSILGVVGSTVTGVQDLGLAQMGLATNALQGAVAARSNIERHMLLRETEMADMTKAENIIRYGGNVLAPDKNYFQFLGPQGMANAKKIADRQVGLDLLMSSKERTRNMTAAGFSVAGGLLQTLGGIVTGNLTGGLSEALTGATLQGATRMVDSSLGAVRSYDTNLISQMEGGSRIGNFLGADYKGRGTDVGLIRQRAVLGLEEKAQRMVREMQDAEMQGIRAGRWQTAIQQEIDLVQSQKEGAVLVGGAATTRREMTSYLDSLAGPGAGPTTARRRGVSQSMLDRAQQMGLRLAGTQSESGLPEAVQRIPMSVFAELEMGMGEFARHKDQLSNYMGRRSTMGDTREMVRMGRAGLGDFQSLLGNMGAINRISGGQDNMDRLREVMASAVSIGFDKSRVAQTFAATATNLAGQLNVTDVGGMAGRLAMGAQAASLTGVADERSLARAAAGIQSFAAFSTSQSGPVSALNIGQLAGAGATSATGLNTLYGMSDVEAQEGLRELERTGRTSNEKVRRLLTLNGGDVNKVKTLLRSKNAGGAAFAGMFANVFAEKGLTLSGVISDFQSKKITRGQLMDYGAEVGAAFPELGAEGGGQAMLSEAVRMGAMPRGEASRAGLRQKINSGMAAWSDPALRNLQNYVDSLVVNFRRDAAGATPEKKMEAYKVFLEKQGNPITISEAAAEAAGDKSLAGQPLTLEMMTGRGKKAAEQMFKGDISMLDIVRSGYESTAAAAGAQTVRVMNFGELAPLLTKAMTEGNIMEMPKNPNVNGE
jgi:hypothetical protein